MQAEELQFIHDWAELDTHRNDPVLVNPPIPVRWIWLDSINNYLTGGVIPPPNYGMSLLKRARKHIRDALAMIHRLENIHNRPPLDFSGNGLRKKRTRNVSWMPQT